MRRARGMNASIRKYGGGGVIPRTVRKEKHSLRLRSMIRKREALNGKCPICRRLVCPH